MVVVNPLLPEVKALRCQRVIIKPRLVTIVASRITPFGTGPPAGYVPRGQVVLRRPF